MKLASPCCCFCWAASHKGSERPRGFKWAMDRWESHIHVCVMPHAFLERLSHIWDVVAAKKVKERKIPSLSHTHLKPGSSSPVFFFFYCYDVVWLLLVVAPLLALPCLSSLWGSIVSFSSCGSLKRCRLEKFFTIVLGVKKKRIFIHKNKWEKSFTMSPYTLWFFYEWTSRESDLAAICMHYEWSQSIAIITHTHTTLHNMELIIS